MEEPKAIAVAMLLLFLFPILSLLFNEPKKNVKK